MYIYLTIFFSLIICSDTESDSLKYSIQDQNNKNFFTNSYRLEQWLSSDGNSEAVSSNWVLYYFEPRNINKMNYDEIVSLPNLTPLDANAVIKQKRLGDISSDFQLKNSGISRYGYKSLMNFIRFDESDSDNFHFRLSSLIRTIPITTNPDSEGQSFSQYSSSKPSQFHKLSISYTLSDSKSQLQYGQVYKQSMGESNDVYTKKNFVQLSYVPLFGSGLRIDHIVVGNFNASFGQGVVFENTDHFSPRRTGYGFSKGSKGI